MEKVFAPFHFEKLPLSRTKTRPRPNLPYPMETSNNTKNNEICTHRFSLIVSTSSSSSTWSCSRCMSSRLLTASCRTEVRAIGPRSLSLGRSLTSVLAGQSLHLIMKGSGKLLVLWGELSDSVLRYPIIPTVQFSLLDSTLAE